MNSSVATARSDTSVLALVRPAIRTLAAYSSAAWEPALERLHANENPWRAPGDGTRAGLNRYPEPQPNALEALLAGLYGVGAERILAARGSDEGIDILTRALCEAGEDAVVVCPPTFAMYELAARIQGAKIVEVPLLRDRGYALDDAGLRRISDLPVKLVWLCSPNNPTGHCLDPRSIERLLGQLAGRALVAIDEAYAEFSAGPGWLARLDEFPNLVVLRTLSKAYALAGARVGAVIGPAPLIEVLRRVRPPYAIPTATSEAVSEALAPSSLAALRGRLSTLRAERARVARALSSCPLIGRVWPSEANFLLVESGSPARVLAAARSAGFLLRDLSAAARTPGAIRISIGTPEQNGRLLDVLNGAGRP
jgi:histidinol-phosphate aminotransferase